MEVKPIRENISPDGNQHGEGTLDSARQPVSGFRLNLRMMYWKLFLDRYPPLQQRGANRFLRVDPFRRMRFITLDLLDLEGVATNFLDLGEPFSGVQHGSNMVPTWFQQTVECD